MGVLLMLVFSCMRHPAPPPPLVPSDFPSALEVYESLHDGGTRAACAVDRVLSAEVTSASTKPLKLCNAEARADVDRCVLESFTAGQAFWARYDATSIDSEFMTAIISTGPGHLQIIHWDEASCVGPDCHGVIELIDCGQPTALPPGGAEQIPSSPLACKRLSGVHIRCPQGS